MKAERLEFNSVKTKQPGGRAEPQVAVAGLRDSIDAAGRQAVLPAPNLTVVLENVPGRIQRETTARLKELKSQHRRQQPALESAAMLSEIWCVTH